MCEEKVSDNAIQIFLNYLLINHREDKILDLLFPIFYIKDIPHEIITNYLIRSYTEETSFYYKMNQLLMKQKGKIIKYLLVLCLKGY